MFESNAIGKSKLCAKLELYFHFYVEKVCVKIPYYRNFQNLGARPGYVFKSENQYIKIKPSTVKFYILNYRFIRNSWKLLLRFK